MLKFETMLENRYGISMANVLDSSTLRQAASWDLDTNVRVAKDTGFHGIEFWPVKRNGMLPDIDFFQATYILSAHQSPRSDIPRRLDDLKLVPFLPGLNGSLEILDEVDGICGGIPVVFYKETPEEFLKKSFIPIKQIQTDPDTCLEWNAKNAHDFLTNACERGFTNTHGNPATVIDTHHIRHASHNTSEENPLADWKTSIPVLLPFTHEIHLGVGRTDYGKRDKNKIKEELIDLLNGGHMNTEIVEMLRFVAQKGWKGLIIVEMRPSAVKEYLGSMSTADILDTYERIRITLHNIFGD